MFTVTVNSIDRTNQIIKDSIEVNDVLTSQVDDATFRIKNKEWIPEKGDEVIIEFDGNTEFGGRIVEVAVSDKIYSEYEVTCQDWSVDFDRKKIAAVYQNMTAKEIIEAITLIVNTELGYTFTTVNVQDTVVFDKVVFNYLEGSKCIEELTDALGWSYYIDPDKDIHFFPKGTESAPFDVSDDSLNVLRETLHITDGFSELRNVVIIRGGEFEGSPRTETYVSDGEQTTVNLSYKFAELPTVLVDGIAITVGVENLDNAELEAETIDALWDYNQKYLRFKTAVTVGFTVETTGIPLFPLIMPIEDAASIAEFGRKEHVIVDKTITATDLAIEVGIAELTAYANGVQNGGFQTYTHGVRSGQVIDVSSAKLGVAGEYLVRSVRMSGFGNTGAIYDVELTSSRVFGIIELLQALILRDRNNLSINENEVPNIVKLDQQTIEITESITLVATLDDDQTIEIEEVVENPTWDAEFVIAPYFPIDDTDPKTPMRIEISSYIYAG